MENLFISGVYSNNGGVFGDVNISGSGKLRGRTECRSFRTSGASSVEGDLLCENFSCSGATAILGKVECTEVMKTSGSLKVEGDAYAGEVHISGAGKFIGDVKAEKLVSVSGSVKAEKNIESGKSVRISGSAKINGDVIGEDIYIGGSFIVGGLINGEKIEIVLGRGSSDKKAAALGGSEITVRCKKEDENFGSVLGFLEKLFVSEEAVPMLETTVIEGDVISLENTKADVVRGNDITIGDGCEIGTVEYTGKVTYSENAKIGQMTEI